MCIFAQDRMDKVSGRPHEPMILNNWLAIASCRLNERRPGCPILGDFLSLGRDAATFPGKSGYHPQRSTLVLLFVWFVNRRE
jgi:hypothetical protein